ncbi:hypothetical protein [Sphingomonas lycopersici]|uniref:Uncharacterized protein n=1 Tax=Sphingomonas lycopersici TaxID=2951807 RepID=A0AA41Z8W7_9SPHN|nr:hypothetical protein [Sphingomonas lycopersici]MCW6536145.1 hypothetical protein [Sphingomonas lycopersici]
MRLSAILSFFATAIAIDAQARAQELQCLAPFPKLLSDEAFARYSVKMPSRPSSAHVSDVQIGEAHLYRTVIRRAVKSGPDFAGHYKIVRIGCGAATVCVAIADTLSGKVYFPPEIKATSALLVDTGSANVNTLNYRPNSSLLIVIGLPNEDSSRAGASHYIWRSGKLHLVHYIPAAKLCSLPPSTRF